MKITLTPIRHDIRLEARREGDCLILNGTACDLSRGETCDWIVGLPELVEGAWHLTLLMPHGADAPEETLFPAVIEMAKDGPLPLPPYDAPPEEAAEAPGPEEAGSPDGSA